MHATRNMHFVILFEVGWTVHIYSKTQDIYTLLSLFCCPIYPYLLILFEQHQGEQLIDTVITLNFRVNYLYESANSYHNNQTNDKQDYKFILQEILSRMIISTLVFTH